MKEKVKQLTPVHCKTNIRHGRELSMTIPVRLHADVLFALDRLAVESHHSRNALINQLLAYGIQHMKTE